MLADGFQTNLGNYFRHLFQTVTYIHDHEQLSEDDKKFYIKRLRGQFSNHEIAVLFLNSFSIGKRWTSYQSRINPVGVDLITKYRLIQNIPSGFFKEFDFRCFFSEIRYEGQTKPFKDYPEFKDCAASGTIR